MRPMNRGKHRNHEAGERESTALELASKVGQMISWKTVVPAAAAVAALGMGSYFFRSKQGRRRAR